MRDVAAAGAPHDTSEWRGSVRVSADRELARELAERYRHASGVRPVAVTDLVDPRRGFWRRTGPPVAMPPERRAAVEAGRALHLGVGRALASEGTLEVRIRRDGIVGRIDLWSDVPTEMKTGPTSVDPSELTALRPDHVEQLAMYCTVVDRSVGRLLYLVTNAGAVEGVRAIDVTLGSSDGRRNEMAARAGSLRTALEAGRSAGLPRCRWFDRGCEFRAARVCDCVGDEAAPGDGLLAAVDRLATRPDVERRVRTAIERSSPPIAAPFVDRFRELLYPRRAYFERVGIPAAPPSAAPPPASATADTYGRLVEAVESGPPGEVRSLPSLADEPAEEVGAFRDLPYLLRTSRAWDPVPADRLLDRSPQYALELGFRCAVTGSPRGRVVLAYERAERDEDRIAVFEVRFASLTPFSRLWRSRANALRAALDREDPASLPACPDWMYADCPYRGDCACGAAADRSQR